jgi:hypothetical protein
MRKYILIMIFFFALFGIGNKVVYAVESDGDFQYEELENGVAIYAYNGAATEVTIPSYLDEQPVIQINDYAFLLSNSVEKIIIPSTVKTIEANAFIGATNLKEVICASKDVVFETEESKESTTDSEKTSYKVKVDSSVETVKETKKKNESSLTETKTTATEIAGMDDTVETKTVEGKSTVTVNEKNQLVSIDENGNEVVLDDTKKYTLQTDSEGNTQIVDENGKTVTKSLSTAANGNKIVIILIIVIIFIGIVLLIGRKKIKRYTKCRK